MNIQLINTTGLRLAGTGTLPDPATIGYGMWWVDNMVSPNKLYASIGGVWILAEDFHLAQQHPDNFVYLNNNVVIEEDQVVYDGLQ